MRVLFGGVVGAAAAAVAWMALEHTTKQELNWMAIVVGLVTGIAVHRASSSASRSSFGRGFLAVLLTLIVCVGSRQAYAKLMERSGMNLPASSSEVSSEASEAGAENTGANSEQSNQPAALVIPANAQFGSGSPSIGMASFKQGLTEWDMLWLSSAALVAYIAGKGRDRTPTGDEAGESSESAQDEPA